MESRFAQESLQAGQRSIVPLTTSPTSGEAVPMGKDELSVVKAGLQKMKIFKDFVSRQRRAKKTCTEQECCDGKGLDAEYDFVSETDSPDDDARGNLDMNKEKAIVQRSFNYETLASAKVNLEDEGWIYYRSCNLDCVENSKSLQQTVKRGILPWRKRKLRFRSRKTKEEPLLKKDYREEGGDDIDFVRRQLSSSDDSSFGVCIHFSFPVAKIFVSVFSNNGHCSDSGDQKVQQQVDHHSLNLGMTIFLWAAGKARKL